MQESPKALYTRQAVGMCVCLGAFTHLLLFFEILTSFFATMGTKSAAEQEQCFTHPAGTL